MSSMPSEHMAAKRSRTGSGGADGVTESVLESSEATRQLTIGDSVGCGSRSPANDCTIAS